MSAKSASFFIREPGRFLADVVEPERIKYEGDERRMENRRQLKDRRIDVRFNITKPDRREKPGRRAEDVLPTFW
ncbi:MAG: hypothetical protein KDI33_16615 [Halioglobus sp.]|nr:hypothetical protein [Halioglobus sp.]